MMRKSFVVLALLLFFLPLPHAVLSGSYTDYTYLTNYLEPAVPDAVPLNCTFFYRDGGTCAILDRIPGESRDSVLLGVIRRLYPDENQDWIRFWNTRLPIGRYYENATIERLNISDGDYYSNNSLRNTWIRLINIYPSAFKEEEGFYYVPDQALVLGSSNVDFVVPDSNSGEWCKQEYSIRGYEVEQKSIIGGLEAQGQIVQFENVLENGERKNLSYSLFVKAEYSQNLWKWNNNTDCDGSNCTITQKCELNVSNNTVDGINLSVEVPVRKYSNAFSYENRMAVPKRGFAKGVVDIELPKDFLFYQITIKGQSFNLRKNDLKIVKRGEIHPVLQINMISSPSKGGTLHITSLMEEETDSVYRAKIRYKLFIENPNISESDCHFYMMTPFAVEEVEDACITARSIAKMKLRIANASEGEAFVIANITDQFSNPIEGIEVEFSGTGNPVTKSTDMFGIAAISIQQHESTQTIVAKIIGSQEYAETGGTVFLPGKGTSEGGKSKFIELVGQGLPIFLIILIVSLLVMFIMRKRSGRAWVLVPIFILLLTSSVFPQNVDSVDNLNVQTTLDACRNYDFDNAVRHLGECSESYRIATEFSAMRRTAAILVANIAPLVVANPDIAPYKTAYSNMVLIALALFRVAWAFNSLYLILNIFDPTKRSKALRQYVWLIVFVIFSYASFSLVQDSISAVNSISVWIAGTDASDTLSQATLSAEFVVENYEMLKLVLPFLNLSYLILLARYITVIGMILFFPFTLLLFFTSATRGVGKAAMMVTFTALGLGVLNSILLLIYNILVQTQDTALAGTFASTFFSASFIIFFGFVNLIVLSISFLSGIVFIGSGDKG